jgi:hypothetical protein
VLHALLLYERLRVVAAATAEKSAAVPAAAAGCFSNRLASQLYERLRWWRCTVCWLHWMQHWQQQLHSKAKMA